MTRINSIIMFVTNDGNHDCKLSIIDATII